MREGEGATFRVVARGGKGLTYQWQRKNRGGSEFVDIAGATSARYTLNSTSWEGDNKAQFRAIVSGEGGSVTSNPARLTVLPQGPEITHQPEDREVRGGEDAKFSVEANGTMPLNYQWQRKGLDNAAFRDIPGAIKPTYAVDPTSWADNGALFRVIVKNPAGTVVSREAILTVLPTDEPPVTIISQPEDATVTAPGSVTFTVVAKGSGILGYQWLKKTSGASVFHNILGATGPSYTLNSTSVSDNGAKFKVRIFYKEN